ncbi:hypothetical protein AB1N83_011806, partial [Pleurotus pulmonarius]
LGRTHCSECRPVSQHPFT